MASSNIGLIQADMFWAIMHSKEWEDLILQFSVSEQQVVLLPLSVKVSTQVARIVSYDN